MSSFQTDYNKNIARQERIKALSAARSPAAPSTAPTAVDPRVAQLQAQSANVTRTNLAGERANNVQQANAPVTQTLQSSVSPMTVTTPAVAPIVPGSTAASLQAAQTAAAPGVSGQGWASIYDTMLKEQDNAYNEMQKQLGSQAGNLQRQAATISAQGGLSAAGGAGAAAAASAFVQGQALQQQGAVANAQARQAIFGQQATAGQRLTELAFGAEEARAGETRGAAAKTAELTQQYGAPNADTGYYGKQLDISTAATNDINRAIAQGQLDLQNAATRGELEGVGYKFNEDGTVTPPTSATAATTAPLNAGYSVNSEKGKYVVAAPGGKSYAANGKTVDRKIREMKKEHGIKLTDVQFANLVTKVVEYKAQTGQWRSIKNM